jgi:poly(ADP-ribose) glycohydrolase ARH3
MGAGQGEGERQRAGGWGSSDGEGERQRAGGWGSSTGEEAFVGALLGGLLGDCLGAPFEGVTTAAADEGEARRRIARALRSRPLPYTDDTQLTLALAEHLLEDDPRIHPDRLVARILERYEDGRGYGPGMRRLVGLWREGRDHREAVTAIFPDGSFGNGAAMRVAPIGLLWAHDLDQLLASARRSAAVTHAHAIGIDGAVVQACAVRTAVIEGAFDFEHLAALPAATEELRSGLAAAARLVPPASPATVAATLGSEATAHRSVPAALWCAASSRDVPAAVTTAVGLDTDTDTIAAMAGAVRGAADGISVLPRDWLEAVEGHEEMRRIAERLWRLAEKLSAQEGDET